MLLAEHDQLDRAEDAFARALERGHPHAAENLADLREYRRGIPAPGPIPVTVEPDRDHGEKVREPAVTDPSAAHAVPATAAAEIPRAEDDQGEGAPADVSASRHRRLPPGVGRVSAPRRLRLGVGLLAFAVGIPLVVANVLPNKGTNAPRSPTVAIEQNAVPAPSTRPAQMAQHKPAKAQKPPQQKEPQRIAATARISKKTTVPNATHVSTPAGSDTVMTTPVQGADRVAGGSPTSARTSPPAPATTAPSGSTSTGSVGGTYRGSSGSGSGSSDTGSSTHAGSGTGSSQSHGSGTGGGTQTGSGSSGNGSGTAGGGSGTVSGDG